MLPRLALRRAWLRRAQQLVDQLLPAIGIPGEGEITAERLFGFLSENGVVRTGGASR